MVILHDIAKPLRADRHAVWSDGMAITAAWPRQRHVADEVDDGADGYTDPSSHSDCSETAGINPASKRFDAHAQTRGSISAVRHSG